MITKLSTVINESKALHETDFVKVLHNPEGEGARSDANTVVGYCDMNTMVIYGMYTSGDNKGLEFVEIRKGGKYLIQGSEKSSYSKEYSFDETPPKWKNAVWELKKVFMDTNVGDDSVAKNISENGVLGNTFYAGETQWKKFKSMCADVLKMKSAKSGGMDIIIDMTHKVAFAKYDLEDGDVYIDMSESSFDAIVARMDARLLKSEYDKTINESKDEINSGDKVKILKGKYANQLGTVDLMLKDTYIIKLKNGKGVEINNNGIEKY